MLLIEIRNNGQRLTCLNCKQWESYGVMPRSCPNCHCTFATANLVLQDGTKVSTDDVEPVGEPGMQASASGQTLLRQHRDPCLPDAPATSIPAFLGIR